MTSCWPSGARMRRSRTPRRHRKSPDVGEPTPPGVLDASALLALLAKEPGGDAVESWLRPGTVMSAVNWSEIVTRAVELDVASGLRAQVVALGMTIVTFDADDAEAAAALRPLTRSSGLSLGDRACLALARRRGLPVVTAERVWAGLNLGVDVRLIR